MEPWNSRLTTIVLQRISKTPDEQRHVALNWLTGHSITAVINALDYAAGLRAEVDETLAQRPPES